MNRGRWACRVVVLLAVLAAIQFVGKPMWRDYRKATVSAEDFQAGRVGWYVDSLGAGTRMHHLWFSADGQSLWVADVSAGVTKWDLSTWKVTEQIKGRPGYRVLGGSPTGVLACTSTGRMELREASSWRCLGVGSGEAYWLGSPSVSSHDGRQVVYSVSARWSIRTSLLDVAVPGGEAVLLERRLVQAVFSRDGSRLVTLHVDHALKEWLSLWDMRSHRQIRSFPVNASCCDRMLCLLGDGHSALVQAYDRQHKRCVLEVRDMRSGQLNVVPIESSAATWMPLAVSPDDRRVAYFERGGEMIVKELAPPHRTVKLCGCRPEYSGAEWPWLLAFSPDGSHLASTMSDGVVRVWNLVEGREEGRLVCFQDGGWLALHGGEGRFLCSPGAERHLFLRKGTALCDAAPYLQRFCSSP